MFERPKGNFRRCDACGLRACKVCGRLKRLQGKRQVCSRECAAKARPQTFAKCERCRRRFGPLSHLKRRFCSKECAYASRRGTVPPHLANQPHPERIPRKRCLKCGARFVAYGWRRQAVAIYCSHHCYLRNRRVSTVEAMVASELARLKVPHQAQVRVGRWTVDFVIGGRIALEVDGDYWHSLPGVTARDQRKNRHLRKAGMYVFRIREHRVRKSVSAAIRPCLRRWSKIAKKG